MQIILDHANHPIFKETSFILKMDSLNSTVNETSQKLLQELYDNQEKLDFIERTELLTKFRILTREKFLSREILDKRCIDLLVKHSSECYTEAQKSLSNLILNYEHVRQPLIEPYIECVVERFRSVTKSDQLPNNLATKKELNDVLYYDLRIIFLLSALCSSERNKIGERLVDLILQLTDREADEFNSENYMLVIESLKTLFNLTLENCIKPSLAGNVISKLFSVVGGEKEETIMKEYNQTNSSGDNLACNFDLTDKLLINLIHLLTNMPKEVYLNLSDSDAVKVLNHLDSLLRECSKDNFREMVLPVLNVCANICKYNERVRQKWLDEIVGSITDFDKRPEEYDNLRGRLVKLMTSVDVHVKDIAAEFMHALFGGDTEKFITYTGFGNSAAFLSSRGLLAGHELGKKSPADRAEDEHDRLIDKINPVTGRLEEPKKNPMDGMSEEEKEYHAHELANAITKLTNLGIMKPMKINESGSVAELQLNEQSSNEEPGEKSSSNLKQ